MRSLHLIIVALIMGMGCGPERPDSLDVEPRTMMQFADVGQGTKLKATAALKRAPFRDPYEVTWSSSNPTAATVDATGQVTARGSGMAMITASTMGKGEKPIEASVEVNNRMVGKVELKGEVPKSFRFASPAFPIIAIITDEKGNALDASKLKWSTSDYCVEVVGEGATVQVKPLAIGECKVIASSGSRSASLAVEVN
jgi:Bacterial Ig-like domain (group 2)